MSATPSPNDYLRVDRRVDETAVVVHAVGEVDLYTAPVLAEQLARATATAAPSTPVVADLREIKFFGSRGFAALVTAHQQCQEQHISLRVVAGPLITHQLELVGLLDVLTVCPTLTEALEQPR